MSARIPRAMLNGPANERLIGFLNQHMDTGIEIVDDCDRELEQHARRWLAHVTVDMRDRRGAPVVAPVVRELRRLEQERR